VLDRAVSVGDANELCDIVGEVGATWVAFKKGATETLEESTEVPAVPELLDGIGVPEVVALVGDLLPVGCATPGTS